MNKIVPFANADGVLCKACTKCGIAKPLDEFQVQRDKSTGRTSACNECLKAQRLRDKEKIRKRNQDFWRRNKEEWKVRNREYWHANKEVLLVKQREYYEKNKEVLSVQQKGYRDANKEAIAKRNKYQYEKNKPARMVYAREYAARKRKEDVNFRLKENLRSRITEAVRRKSLTKKAGLSRVLGCEWDVLKAHLESHFEDWMTWENYGRNGWVIDHHVPLATAETAEQLAALCHYTNLRPLCGIANRRKGATIPD